MSSRAWTGRVNEEDEEEGGRQGGRRRTRRKEEENDIDAVFSRANPVTKLSLAVNCDVAQSSSTSTSSSFSSSAATPSEVPSVP